MVSAVGRKARVMVVDDSATIRGLIGRILRDDPEIEIVASVENGRRAVQTLETTPVDVVVLDIEMPEMDGITAIPQLLRVRPGVRIVMASTLTLRNAEIALKALALGAADYVPKPTTARDMIGATPFNQELLLKVRSLGGLRERDPRAPAPAPAAAPKASLYPTRSVQLRAAGRQPPQAIAIGSSTGGPQALLRLLTDLGPTNLPVFITQHMPPTFTTLLAQNLARTAGLDVREAADQEKVERGRVYLAPGNHHLVVRGGGRGLTPTPPVVALNQDPPENYCRPSVDPMLRSLASAYGGALLVIILTGMGHDGLEGSRAAVAAGASVIAQDEASSVVWGMPGAVATAGLCSAVLPLDKLGKHARDIVQARTPENARR